MQKIELTQEYLMRCLLYSPDTGVFTWLSRPTEHFSSTKNCRMFNTRWSGNVAGGKNNRGYIFIGLDGRNYLAHRLAWLYVTGKWPNDLLDHIDGNRINNRIANLREATHMENFQNTRNPYKNNATGMQGVSYHKASGKYAAQLQTKHKQRHLGLYLTPEEAFAAYVEAKRKQHPFCTI